MMKWKNGLLIIILVTCALLSKAQVIFTVVGGGTGRALGDGGPATAATIGLTGGIAVDIFGNIYIGDANNARIRKVNATTGIISTIAGTGVAGYNGDGIPATSSQLNTAIFITVDTSGNIYIDDAGNYRIRRIDAATGIIKTVAGTGTSGVYGGDGGPATDAVMFETQGIILDGFGNLYINDIHSRRVRKVDTAGIITTVLGTGIAGNRGDGGPATDATVSGMLGICADRFGNIFVTDSSCSLRKIDAITGIVSRVAGLGDHGSPSPYSGDGGAATAARLGSYGAAVGYYGEIYSADYDNDRIEMVDTLGIIHTIAGTGTHGFTGDGGLATAAELNYPENVVLDDCGNLYIADKMNVRIRKVTMPPSLVISLTGLLSAAVGDTVTVTASVHNAGLYTITWLNNGVPFATTTTPSVSYIKTLATDSITAVVYGCSDSAVSAVHVVTDSRLGVGQVAAGGSVSLYPNPGHSEFSISSPERVVSVVVTNLTGEVVYTGASAVVNVKPWPPGMYFVKVNGVSVLKFLKE